MPRLSLVLATAALAVGLAVVAIQILGEDPPGSHQPEPAAPLALAFGIGLVAGLWPATKAVRLRPSQALRAT